MARSISVADGGRSSQLTEHLQRLFGGVFRNNNSRSSLKNEPRVTTTILDLSPFLLGLSNIVSATKIPTDSDDVTHQRPARTPRSFVPQTTTGDNNNETQEQKQNDTIEVASASSSLLLKHSILVCERPKGDPFHPQRAKRPCRKI